MACRGSSLHGLIDTMSISRTAGNGRGGTEGRNDTLCRVLACYSQLRRGILMDLSLLLLLLLCLGCTRAKPDASTLASLHEQADSEPVLEARERERETRKGRSIALVNNGQSSSAARNRRKFVPTTTTTRHHLANELIQICILQSRTSDAGSSHN